MVAAIAANVSAAALGKPTSASWQQNNRLT
jgi:hypothetical protein